MIYETDRKQVGAVSSFPPDRNLINTSTTYERMLAAGIKQLQVVHSLMPIDDSSHSNSTSTPASSSPSSTESGSTRRLNYVLLASGLFLGIAGMFITAGPSLEGLPAMSSAQLYSEIITIADLLFQVTVANRTLIGPLIAALGVFLGGIALGLQIQRK